METSLKLKYSGPAVEQGLMDVYQASANMIAFSEFMVSAAKASYGEQVQARAEVAGFGRGSFVTHLVFSFAGEIATVFAAFPAADLLKTINQAFQLWKHLRGQPAKAVERIGNTQTVSVTNNDGQIIQVQTQTLQLVLNEKASEAVKQFVQIPLTSNGIDAVEIDTPQDAVVARANQNEAGYFRSVQRSEEVTDIAVPMTLVIEAPVFKEGNKWRFSDGQTSFYADILDREFLARVDNGERFGKGDLLRVELRIQQARLGHKIETDRAIIKVHSHVSGPSQTQLML